MTYQVRQIIIGAAALYVSTADSTSTGWATLGAGGVGGPPLPANPGAGVSFTTALDGASTNWRHAGFTSEGLELSYEPDYGDVVVDQLLDSAKLFKQAMRVMLNTTLTEASLENLLVVWAQPTNVGGSSQTSAPKIYSKTAADVVGGDVALAANEEELGISSGSLGDDPVERALVAVGPAPRTSAGLKRERVYRARRALQVSTTAHALRRNEATVFPVSFRLLPDPAFSGAEYGTIKDRIV